jgi:predicted PurR-regulated permease PerM
MTGQHGDVARGGTAIAARRTESHGLLALATGVAVVAALYCAQQVLIPLTLAVLLSFVLAPVVDGLDRLRLWRAPAVIITVLAALGIISAAATLIGSQAAGLASDAPRYAQTIETKIGDTEAWATRTLARFTRLPGSTAPSGIRPAVADQSAMATTEAAAQPVPVKVTNERSSPYLVIKSIVGPVLAPLETTIIVLVVSIFILMQKEDLRDRFVRLFGSIDPERTGRAMDEAGQRLSRYFLAQALVNSAFGLVIGLGTWLIGIPAPAMWGILAGLLRFVPYIGSALAAIMPVALGAAIDPGWSMAIAVALLFLVAEPVTGYVVEPLLYGRSTGLTPIAVVVAAIVWTWLWGPVGLILSTPLTLCLVVLGRHVRSLAFFDILLGDGAHEPAISTTREATQV